VPNTPTHPPPDAGPGPESPDRGAAAAGRRDQDEQARAIVLFDGVCHLCQRSVRFIVAHDPAGYFGYAPLQSPAAREWLPPDAMATGPGESLVLVEGGRVFTRSTAALRIARRLGGSWSPWRLLAMFLVIPAPLRDAVYDWMARRRYQWFGRSDACEIAPEARRHGGRRRP
jgi:predicted DCC family thiol-disulfide oxidoreductase YuxK